MSTNKSKGTILDPGICRCCGSWKKCRVLNEEYVYSGEIEVYSDKFVDCFGLLLSYLDAEITKRLICATCVGRLREACSFRQQVLLCEEKLLKSEIQVHAEGKQEGDVKEETVKCEGISSEPCNNDSLDENYDGDLTNDASLPETDSQLSSKSENDKIQMLSEIKQTRFRLKKLQKVKKKPARKLNPDKTDDLDDSNKALRNTITLVENSYVCPFYSFYNDYYCSYCHEKFTDPERLKNHVANHDATTYKDVACKKKLAQIDISRIDCRLCPAPINDLNQFKKHITNEHNKVLYDEVTNEYLTFNLKTNNFVCTECNTQYGYFHNLKKHMAIHFGSFTCDICGTHFFYERLLSLHQKTHEKSAKLHECRYCGKKFKSKNCRNIHVASVHTKEAIYDCSKCDDAFFTEGQRYRHMKEIHGEDRTYSCEQCDKVYDRRRSLSEHVRKIHLKLFKHECDICHRRFYLPSRLKEHMTSHTGERNYKCDDCGKSYPRLRALKVHMQTHNGEKKFICAVCGASFTQNVSLKNHVKKQHQHL